jgi:adenosine deaminase
MTMPLRAVLGGLAIGREEHGLPTRLILDHSRRRPAERAWVTLRLAESHAGDGVVAVGLSGLEACPGDPFAAVFRGQAERLGHGVRVLEDRELTAEVAALAIPLEVCPHSNVLLGLVPSLAEHPLPQLLDAGLAVTVNADIPAMTGAGLAEEYRQLRETFGYNDAVIAGVASAGARASFAPDDLRAELLARIEDWLS